MQGTKGFTLIELSIVLVIVGLIIGGVLAGQELIRAASVRATIAQVEKYNQAANTFYGKYGYLPGDIPAAPAAQFGFASRGQYAGEGDGNGLIQGVDSNAANQNDSANVITGETGMFWVDLSVAHLIDGSFNTASPTTVPGTDPTGTAVDNYLPQAKIGKGNHFFVWSGGWPACYLGASGPLQTGDGFNYFGLSDVTGVYAPNGEPYNAESLTPVEAYAIDSKIDDGYPQSGRVLALYPSVIPGNNCWAAGGGTSGAYNASNAGPTTATVSPTATTCYDNGGNGGNQTYSLSSISRNGANCALSFRFQ